MVSNYLKMAGAGLLGAGSGTRMFSYSQKGYRGDFGIKKYREARKKKNKAARAARKVNRK